MYYARMYLFSSARNLNHIFLIGFCGISRRMRDPFENAAAFYRERIQNGNVTVDKFHVRLLSKVSC